MTPDRPARNPLGSPLGRRLLAAFVVVALSSVVALTAAALVGTDRGLATVERSGRAQVAARTAEAAAAAYTRAGGWAGADLSAAATIAEAAGARLVVQDVGGVMVWPGRGMSGPRIGGMHAADSVVTAPIVAVGEDVGTVRLGFTATAAPGRGVAWSWVIAAAAVALAAALLVASFVAVRLTRPLTALGAAARRFAAGDRAARARVRAPGELGEVAHAFDVMAEEVERAERVRRHLAADVAHELRTPLAALQAGLEELRDGLQEPDAARLGLLHDQALRLGRVVQDLADLSAAEAAALSLRARPIDLAGVARDALDAQRPQLAAAGLRVEVAAADALPVHADPDRLHQAIANVLTNAFRYCRPGDAVSLRAYADGLIATVAVADTGPGIDPGDLPYVFQRLWRGSRSSDVAGSGIGLAVASELVAAHGGSITAESPAGGGTTITIRLPLASAPSSPASPGPPADIGSLRRRPPSARADR